MTTHGPIYRMVEEEKEKLILKWDRDKYISQFIDKIKPKIQSLEPVWIPVTERLPEPGWVLLATEDGACHVAYYDMRKKEWVANSKFGKNPEKWLPLPPTE